MWPAAGVHLVTEGPPILLPCPHCGHQAPHESICGEEVFSMDGGRRQHRAGAFAWCAACRRSWRLSRDQLVDAGEQLANLIARAM